MFDDFRKYVFYCLQAYCISKETIKNLPQRTWLPNLKHRDCSTWFSHFGCQVYLFFSNAPLWGGELIRD